MLNSFFKFRRSFAYAVIVLVNIFVVLSGANALALPSTLTMNCVQAADLVSARSPIILSTGQFTYDRFVTSGDQCAQGESMSPAWVPTSDSSQCFIGYTCGQDHRR